MSNLQTRAQLPAVASQPRSDAELLAGFKAQFRYFYGQERGYFPIDEAIRDDESTTGILMLLPTDDKPDVPNMRVWCYYDPDRPNLLDTVAAIALETVQRSGNTYRVLATFAGTAYKSSKSTTPHATGRRTARMFWAAVSFWRFVCAIAHDL